MLLSLYQMRIISWNCNMAFRKKAHVIIKEHPDVLIVQECEHIDKIKTNSWDVLPSDSYWYGNNPNKGVAVFTFNNYFINSTLIEHNELYEYVIPLVIAGDNLIFDLYAVWTQRPYDDKYTRQILGAVEYYKERLVKSRSSIIIGDLNSSSIFDKSKPEFNHTKLVNILSSINIHSAYHHVYDEKQGEESLATLYFQRNIDKKFHIDFCFMSGDLLSEIDSFALGDYHSYIEHSDHMPLLVDI